MRFLGLSVRSRHATDRRIGGQTDTDHHFIMFPPVEVWSIIIIIVIVIMIYL